MDFVILKVNGHDLSGSSHEDAVQAFQSAKEPIIVEVLRRVSKESSSSSPSTMRTGLPSMVPSMVSTSTQTEEYIENTYCNIIRPPHNFCTAAPLVKPSSRHGVAFSATDDLGLTDLELANGLAVDDSFDDGKTYDMEYEEVTLCRTSGDQKVGLTLCYGSTEDEITDIFISEVEADSIAANDGRIREGDQILQINGTDVRCRQEAIRLFAGSHSHITLLLARPQLIQMDDGFMEGRSPLGDLNILDHTRSGMDFSTSLITTAIDEEGGTTDTATTENSCHKQDKDSGVGRTDDSTRNDESSEQELLENDCTSPSSDSHFAPEGMGNADLHLSNDSFTSNETHDHECVANEIAAEECDKFREVLETRCGGAVSCGEVVADEQGNHLPRQDSQTSLEREIAALNKEMEDIQLECQQIIDHHAKERHKTQAQSDVLKADTSCRVPRLVPKMGTRLDYIKQLQAAQDAGGGSGGGGNDPVWMRKEQLAYLGQVRELTPPLGSGALSAPVTPAKPSTATGADKQEKDTSTSAYNTGESNRSTPLTLDLRQASDGSSGHKNSMLCLSVPPPPPVQPKRPSHSDSEKIGGQPVNLNLVMREWSSDGDHRRTAVSAGGPVANMSQVNSRLSQTETQRNESLQQLYAQYADVMYTNTANLQHTMEVQQKLFQQQLAQRGQQQANSTTTNSSTTPPPITTPNGNTHSSPRRQNPLPSPSKAPPSPEPNQINNNNNIEPPCSPNNVNSDTMEYVVKRRADGSRYITRRPVRSKILKERAKKLTEERVGMTTDDDAMSELKVGRYWSREDRKRHLEKARDHRKQKELMIQSKMETVKEKEESTTRKEVNIVELSHRKMMRHKERKVLDDFTTLQEMMAHGSRDHQGKQTYNPLLSVTTV